MDCVDKCDYNSAYIVKCGEENIPLLSQEQHQALMITDEIGDNIYEGLISNYAVWVKYTGTTLDKEICMQIKASSAGLSPKILGYWKCSNVDFGYIVMERASSYPANYNFDDGTPIDPEEFYFQVATEIARLNDLGIIHNQNHGNIIYDNGKVMFVDFENSEYVNPENKYKDLEAFTYGFEWTIIMNYTTWWPDLDKYGSLVELVKHMRDKEEREENVVEKKFKCSSDDLEIDCSQFTEVNIPQLTQDQLNSIEIGTRIGEGAYGQVYSGKLGNKNIALKYFRGNSLNEVCIQEYVAKNKLAPKVLSYWKCKEGRNNMLIMDKINGEVLNKFIKQENNGMILSILAELSSLVHFMNFELGIRHNDLHTNNIMFDSNTKRLIFLDFGLSKKMPPIQELEQFYTKDYIDIYSNPEIEEKIYPYFSDLAMMMNRAAIMIQKQMPTTVSSYKLVDIITVNNLDDYSGWFRIFKSYKAQRGTDLTSEQLGKIIKNLFESSTSGSMPRNVITKFHLCTPTGENIKLDCVSDKLWTKEINQLRREDLEKLDANSLRLKDRTITLYDGKWGQINVSIIYLIESGVSMKQQICFHAMASDFSISPEIIGYWKCPESNFTLLATIYIDGLRLNNYLKQKNDKTTFMRLASAILSLNLNLRIINENIVYNNIIMSDKSISILSYPRARKLEESVLLNELTGTKRNDGIYIDLLSISNMFGLGGNKQMKTFILENKLNQTIGWRKIYQTVYANVKVIPQSGDIYDYLKTKLG